MSSNAHESVSDDAPQSASASSVEERAKELMERAAPQQRRYKTLQEMTGIASDRWSAVALGRQRPTAEMLGALCDQFKELTLWLMTGHADPRNKQWDLDTFFARRTVRLSSLLDQPSDTRLSYEDYCVLKSSQALATSLQDIERIECKRAAKDIQLRLPSAMEEAILKLKPAMRRVQGMMASSQDDPDGLLDGASKQPRNAPEGQTTTSNAARRRKPKVPSDDQAN